MAGMARRLAVCLVVVYAVVVQASSPVDQAPQVEMVAVKAPAAPPAPPSGQATVWIGSMNVGNLQASNDSMKALLATAIKHNVDLIVLAGQEDASEGLPSYKHLLTPHGYLVKDEFVEFFRTITKFPKVARVSLSFAIKETLVPESNIDNLQFKFEYEKALNKGGIALWVRVNNIDIAVVGGHVDTKDQDATHAMFMKSLEKLSKKKQARVPTTRASELNDPATAGFDAVFVTGDLNYRMELPPSTTAANLLKGVADGTLQSKDSNSESTLITQYKFHLVPLKKDPPSLPTYKIEQIDACKTFFANRAALEEGVKCYLKDAKPDAVVTPSAKGRTIKRRGAADAVPVLDMGWLDRILYRTRLAHPLFGHFEIIEPFDAEYGCLQEGVDHLPVRAAFRITMGRGAAAAARAAAGSAHARTASVPAPNAADTAAVPPSPAADGPSAAPTAEPQADGTKPQGRPPAPQARPRRSNSMNNLQPARK